MATLLEQLAEARDAYHRLMTGQSVRVFVDQNGERIEYNSTNSSRLASYIADLERKVGEVTAGRLGPMRVMF